MFMLDSEEALLKAFRPKDRATVEAPPQTKFPLFVRNYLSWTHPAGGRVFLVFTVPHGVPTGVVFETNGAGGPTVPAMCDWCHQTARGTDVGLLTAQRNARKKVGINVCVDLSCQQKLEDEANRAGHSALPALERLLERMGKFAQEALDIDLSGERRS